MQISSINSSLRVLRRLLRVAVEWGVIPAAPKIKLLRGERHSERVITSAEEAKYLAAAPQSAHKSRPVTDFLAVHPKVHLHFTPTYSSWLNQVELWFSKIDRDVIARGVFTSVSDLKRKLLRYIRHYNKSPRTVKWKYADPSRHLGTQSVGTGH